MKSGGHLSEEDIRLLTSFSDNLAMSFSLLPSLLLVLTLLQSLLLRKGPPALFFFFGFNLKRRPFFVRDPEALPKQLTRQNLTFILSAGLFFFLSAARLKENASFDSDDGSSYSIIVFHLFSSPLFYYIHSYQTLHTQLNIIIFIN